MSQGSETPPKLIHVWWEPKGKAKGGWFSQTVKGLSPGKPYTVEIRATSAAGSRDPTPISAPR